MSMNLLQKIAKARTMFQESGVKQSGQNKFAGYSYFELSDILPKINNIGLELGFLCVACFATDKASLTIHDCDSDAKLVFESPMSTASLKGCHEVQNLGAVETYIKRYLYQNAFEIVEHDAVNSTHNPDEKPAHKPTTPAKPASVEQSNDEKQIIADIRKADLDKLEAIGKLIAEKYPNKTAPLGIRNEYQLRQRELVPQ
jgi:hypothetical protein